MQRVRGELLAGLRRARRLSGGIRRRHDRGRLAGGAYTRGIWRVRIGRARRLPDPGRDQPFGRQRCCVPCPDVHHGLDPQSRQRGAEAQIPAACRRRQPAPAGVRRDRARRRFQHAQDQDLRQEGARRLCDQRPEDLDLALHAVAHVPADHAHHAVRRGQEKRPMASACSWSISPRPANRCRRRRSRPCSTTTPTRSSSTIWK